MIEDLGAIDTSAASALVKALRSHISTVRLRAAHALGNLVPQATEAVPVLLETLRDETTEVAVAALRAIRAIGEPAFPALVEVLRTGDPATRWGAAYALDRHPMIGPAVSAVPDLLEAAMCDGDLGVRRQATHTLLRIALGPDLKAEPCPPVPSRLALAHLDARLPGTLHRLLGILLEEVAADRQSLCRQPGKLVMCCAQRFLPILCDDLSRCDDPRTRRELAEWLSRLGSTVVQTAVAWTEAYDRGQFPHSATAADESLTASVHRDGWRAKSSLEVCWVDVGDFRSTVESVALRLGELLTHPDDRVRSEAGSAVAAIRDEVPVLVGCFRRSTSFGVWDEVLGLSRRILPVASNVVQAFAELLGEPNPRLRDRTVKALTVLGQHSPPAIGPLAESLGHPALLVREHVAHTLGQVGPPARSAVPALIDAILRADEVEPVRVAVAGALESIDGHLTCVVPEAVVPQLNAARRSTVLHVRQSAIRLLARIAPEELEHAAERDELPGPPSAEDERILGWFSQIKLDKYIGHLQLFWCIGVIDREAVDRADKALSYAKISKRLQHTRPMFGEKQLPTGGSHLCNTCLPDLDGLFDRDPFLTSAWPPEEQSLPLRTSLNNRDETWTAKTRRAWHYVDRFLTIRRLLPVFGHPPGAEKS